MRKLNLLLFIILITCTLDAQTRYFPPEFEKQEGLLMTWDYHPQRDPVTAAVAKAIQPSAKVWIIYYPGQAPLDSAEIRTYLRSQGVQDENVYLIPGWTETLWIRDYGPFSGYNLQNILPTRYFIDAGYSAYNRPKDDSIPAQLGNLWGIPVTNIPLQFEGGNVLFDGTGRGWGSTRIFEQNPGYSQAQVKEMLEEYFGLEDFMFLQKLTNSGGGQWAHVDMYMKILDSETIMISQYPDYLPDYFLIESFALTLANMTNFDGVPYRIVRIPAPPKANGTWATTQNDEMRTYTNSIIMNDVIVVPSYNLPEYDTIAKHIYQENMPGYRIEMVDATVLTPLYGALHCITKEITKPEYLRIRHQRITGELTYTNPYMVIDARIDCNLTADSTFVYYKFNSQPGFSRTPMSPGCPYYVGVINGIQPDDTVHYYIYTARNGDEVVLPPPAPESVFTFWFNQSVMVNEAISATNKLQVYPNPGEGSFSVVNPYSDNNIKMIISDLSGKKIIQKAIGKGVNYMNFEDKLVSGIYLITIDGNGLPPTTSKLIIRK